MAFGLAWTVTEDLHFSRRNWKSNGLLHRPARTQTILHVE